MIPLNPIDAELVASVVGEGLPPLPIDQDLQLLDNEGSSVINELDLLPMNEIKFAHQGLVNIKSALTISSNIDSADIFYFHLIKMKGSLIKSCKALQSRKDYILPLPYISVRSERLWRMEN